MTNIAELSKVLFMGIIKYIAFVWGVSWRTAILSILCAVVVGIAVGIMSASQSWPPSQMNLVAGFVATPLTLSIFAYIVFRQIKRNFLQPA